MNLIDRMNEIRSTKIDFFLEQEESMKLLNLRNLAKKKIGNSVKISKCI